MIGLLSHSLQIYIRYTITVTNTRTSRQLREAHIRSTDWFFAHDLVKEGISQCYRL